MSAPLCPECVAGKFPNCAGIALDPVTDAIVACSSRCRHCGRPPEADGDHTCTCPNPDGLCLEHDRAPSSPAGLEP